MKMIRRISNLVSLCMLLAYVIVLVCIWSRIPGTVPTHFNAAGIADSYGGKGILWIEVIAATVILLLLSLIEKVPSIWNFPVAVTEENKERLYKIALVMLGAIKILTTGLFIDVGVSSLVTRFPVHHAGCDGDRDCSGSSTDDPGKVKRCRGQKPPTLMPTDCSVLRTPTIPGIIKIIYQRQ